MSRISKSGNQAKIVKQTKDRLNQKGTQSAPVSKIKPEPNKIEECDLKIVNLMKCKEEDVTDQIHKRMQLEKRNLYLAYDKMQTELDKIKPVKYSEVTEDKLDKSFTDWMELYKLRDKFKGYSQTTIVNSQTKNEQRFDEMKSVEMEYENSLSENNEMNNEINIENGMGKDGEMKEQKEDKKDKKEEK